MLPRNNHRSFYLTLTQRHTAPPPRATRKAGNGPALAMAERTEQEKGVTKVYSVKEVADLAKVSVRTLHHYDAVDLLKPAGTRPNGYRYYGREELLRLQEIRILRDLDMGLEEIRTVLDAEESERAERLVHYRNRLSADLVRRRQLIATLDRTIGDLKGEGRMTDENLYDGLAPETQAEYEAWLVERYGETMKDDIAAVRAKLQTAPDGKLSPGGEAMDELRQLEAALVRAFENGAAVGARDLTALLSEHRAWVGDQWGRSCTSEAYAGLADLYLAHPDFVARYEALAPGFSVFLTDAMKAFAADNSRS